MSLASSPTAPSASREQKDCPSHSHRRRRLGAVVLLVGGCSLLGTGAFASWQATASASSASLRAATVGATVVGATGGQLTTPVSDLLPGDWLYRYVDVTNTSTVVGAFTGTVSSAALGSGLTAVVESCSAAWNTAAATCPGTQNVLASGSVGSGLAIAHGILAPTAVQHVRYKVTVDPSAPASLMGTTGSLSMSVVSDLVGNRDRTTG
ncbi:hypothetical protein FHN55_02935 [Streptomyces sp. NP160]|uniref:hypothetical protein n=1 Tax=Streptomyces sp. NP160 TaxID=2586637 RepID=UPI00111B7120|nr:hypothetical protein [Streptomyces sp. NP160]TNM69715.1 hypothetical protein FHN55_02935 [Streptomyces sp. NP160]